MHRRSATRCGMTASVKPPLAAAPASAVVEVATWSGTETLRASGVFTQKGLTSADVTERWSRSGLNSVATRPAWPALGHRLT